MSRVLLVFVLCFLCMFAGLLVWLSYGSAPVAVNDPPIPLEDRFTKVALDARVQREMIVMTPIKASEANLIAGARIYTDKCAMCHGLHGRASEVGDYMYPHAPSLWEQHRNSTVVGVSDDPPGATFWKVANGIRLTGMPSYRGVLSDEQMWQVSLLLANADKPLPPEALQLLRVEGSPAARISAAVTRKTSAEKLASDAKEAAPKPADGAKQSETKPAESEVDPPKPAGPLVLRVMPPPKPADGSQPQP